jgi:hypothetical protein
MKTITFLGHQFTVESIKHHYLCNANGLKKMAEKSLKTGKYNGFTTQWLRDKAEMYEQMANNLR